MKHIETDHETGREILRLTSQGWEPEAAAAHVARMAARNAQEPRRAPEAGKTTTGPHAAQGGRTGGNKRLRQVVVTIPTAPPKELMPNQQSKQGHWSPRSRARKELRNESAWQAAMMLPPNWEPIAGPVALEIYVHWPKRRRPDLDAAVSSVKAACDGLADAGVMQDDRQIRRLTATQDYGATEPGLTRLTITELPQ